MYLVAHFMGPVKTLENEKVSNVGMVSIGRNEVKVKERKEQPKQKNAAGTANNDR